MSRQVRPGRPQSTTGGAQQIKPESQSSQQSAAQNQVRSGTPFFLYSPVRVTKATIA